MNDVYLGCDPEFFFSPKDGDGIIGSEKILPQGGLYTSGGKVVVDGVQAELNPAATYCRQILKNNIAYCFQSLATQASSNKAKLNFSTTVKMKKEELDVLSDSSKVFGCAPSKNIKGDSKIEVNPSTYLYRSAGGHIHLGDIRYYAEGNSLSKPAFPKIHTALNSPELLVPVLDRILGNTCVLIDRDPGNKERRKVYGKAGEFRTPKHGLEYRTLSNFWLRSYPVMSLVFSLARYSVHIVAQSTKENNFAQQVIDSVPNEEVENAINGNRPKLARDNYGRIAKAVQNFTPEDHQYNIFTRRNIPVFKHFANKKLSKWFPLDPLKYWTTSRMEYGWESYMDVVLKPSLANKKSKSK